MTNAALERPTYIKFNQHDVEEDRLKAAADKLHKEEGGQEIYLDGYNAVQVVKFIHESKLVHTCKCVKKCPFRPGTPKAALWLKGVEMATWELTRYLY